MLLELDQLQKDHQHRLQAIQEEEMRLGHELTEKQAQQETLEKKS